ncbi:MAG: BrnA antitoxin family protein [Caldilineales bacterium]|nr:BrnA antitoxin family protein [Caldilineales bacterium]
MNHEPNPELIDDENPEWTEEEVRAAIPFTMLPESLQLKLAPRKRGPQKEPIKERITIRLSRDVVEQFRATGEGWQTRVDVALREWLRTHQPA